jgi:hypothetical protein
MNSRVTPEEKPFSDYYSKVSKNCTYPPNLPKVDPETVFTEDQREIFNHLLNCIDYCLRDNAIKSQRVYVLENNVEEMYERVAVLSYHVEVLSDQLNKLASILNNMFKPS